MQPRPAPFCPAAAGILVLCLAILATAPFAAAQAPKAPGAADDALHTLTLTVIDQESGKPLANLPLAVNLDTGQTHTSTDEQGRAMLNLLADQKFVSIAARPDGYVPMQVTWRSDQGTDPVPDAYTLKLEKGTSIGGLIQDEQGKPIANAKVHLLLRRKGDTNNSRERVAIWDQALTTDEQGRWRFEQAPREMESPWIRLSHPDYLSDETFGATAAPPLEKLRDFSGVMVMKRGVPVSGRVLDFDGQPIAGAEVAQGRDRFGSNYPKTRTDGSGSFSFANVRPAAQLVLTVTARGYAPELKTVAVAADPIDLDIKLEPGRTIRGRVVDASGKPIPRVLIATDTWRGFRSLLVRLYTDAQGRFTWNEAPADEILTDFLKQGYMDVRRKPIKASDQEIEIVLKAPLQVRGSVVDAQSKKPIEAYTVVQGIVHQPGLPPYWDRRSARDGSKPGGRFQLDINYPQPGYAIRIEAPGYLPAVSSSFKDDQPQVNLEFALKPVAIIKGVVVDSKGQSVAGADLILCTPGQGAYIQNGRLQQRESAAVIVTDEQGRFALSPQEGNFTVAVLHEKGYIQMPGQDLMRSAAEGGAPAKIILEPWATVTGIAMIGGRPAADHKVSVNRFDNGGPEQPRIYHQIDAATGADGRFTIGRIPAGKVSVAMQVPLGERMTGYANSTTITLKAGQTQEVKLGGTGRPITGRVKVPDALRDQVDWNFSQTGVRTDVKAKPPPQPANLAAMDDAARRKWWQDWQKSPEGQAYQKANEAALSFPLRINNDDTFRIEDVPAGDYALHISLMKRPADGRGWSNELLAGGSLKFTVPEMPGGRSDEALDVGEVELKPIPAPAAAPPQKP